jgi:DNA recombination protein RmuC
MNDSETATLILGILLGGAVGGVVAWLASRVRHQRELSLLSTERATLAAQLEGERRITAQQQLALTADDRQRGIEAQLTPIRETLDRVDGKLRQVELDRTASYASLGEQLRSLASTQQQIHAEQGNLVKALRSPTVRGRWGEIQLRRVCEMAGMLAYCDFTEQDHLSGADGARLRPDLTVRLPGGKCVIVDAKAPLAGYLDAVEATDDATREARLRDHARHVRDHMTQLASRGYWDQIGKTGASTPEFVVMFLPGETFFSAALQYDPSLIEYGVDKQVIPASPTTLIALLRAVAYGWRQESMAENAREIAALGGELHERVRALTEHFVKMRRGLEHALESYNSAVGSLERKVLVQTRRFRDLGAATGEPIPSLEPIDLSLRVSETQPQ